MLCTAGKKKRGGVEPEGGNLASLDFGTVKYSPARGKRKGV